ncbi:4750_t:CDS:2, partial [Racocetra fulgida]
MNIMSKNINAFKRNPYRGLKNLQNTLDLRADEWEEDFFLPSELNEDKNHFYLKIHLPEVEKENTKIEITDRVLRISGERKEKKVVEGDKKHYSEVFYGSFARDFSLPENTDSTNIKANFESGVLTITIPKSPESGVIGGEAGALAIAALAGNEVIQPLEPKIYHDLSQQVRYEEKWWKPGNVSFTEFFSNFWSDAPIYFSDYGSHSIYSHGVTVKVANDNKNETKFRKEVIRPKIDEIKNDPDFYERTPFLTLAEDLLKLVKENKAEIIFLSAYDQKVFTDGDPRKKKIFAETFGRLPSCSLHLVGFEFSKGKNNPTKSQWVSENHPDCHIMIDDNPNILKLAAEKLPHLILCAPYYHSTIKHHSKLQIIAGSSGVALGAVTGVIISQLTTKKLIQQEKQERILLRYEISESIKELKE